MVLVKSIEGALKQQRAVYYEVVREVSLLGAAGDNARTTHVLYSRTAWPNCVLEIA